MKFDWDSILQMDEKARLKKLMRRPGLFVGAPRLDYLLHFAAGLHLGETVRNKDSHKGGWNSNTEMQHWMLTRHSAVIRRAATLNAPTLFFRYFGTGALALSEFSRYLHCDDYLIIASDDNTASPISDAVYSLYSSKKDDIEFRLVKAEIISTIMELVSRYSQSYDEIRVYIRRVCYFASIRFVFHTNQGWKDDMEILKDGSHFSDLLRLHALLECVNDSDLPVLAEQPSQFFVHADVSEISADHKITDIGHLMKEEDALFIQYEQWKTCISSTY